MLTAERNEIARDYPNLENAGADLLEACRQIIWKLSHNHSPSGNGDDCHPATITRDDISVKMAASALKFATLDDSDREYCPACEGTLDGWIDIDGVCNGCGWRRPS